MKKDEFRELLSEYLFWDVDRESVDVEVHDQFLIPRIMDRGALPDVKAAWAYYGEERVKKALLSARSLNKKTIAFFANQFGLSRQHFRAYRDQTGMWNQ